MPQQALAAILMGFDHPLIEFYTSGLSDAYFLCAMALAVLYLFFRSLEQFEKPLDPETRTLDDPPGVRGPATQITHRFFYPKEICAQGKWRLGRAIYVGFIFLIFFFLTPISAPILETFGTGTEIESSDEARASASVAETIAESAAETGAAADAFKWTLPLLTAFMISGLVPSLPFVNSLERFVRRFAHRQSGIPDDVKHLALMIRSLKLPDSRALKDMASELAQHEAEPHPGAEIGGPGTGNTRTRSWYARELLGHIAEVEKIRKGSDNPDSRRLYDLFLRVRYIFSILENENFGNPETMQGVVERHEQLTENARMRIDWIEDRLNKADPDHVPDTGSDVFQRLDETHRTVSYLLAVKLLAGSGPPGRHNSGLEVMLFAPESVDDFPHNFENTLALSIIVAGSLVFFAMTPLVLLLELPAGTADWLFWPDIGGNLYNSVQWIIVALSGSTVFLRTRAYARSQRKWYNHNRKNNGFGIRNVRIPELTLAVGKSVIAMLFASFVMTLVGIASTPDDQPAEPAESLPVETISTAEYIEAFFFNQLSLLPFVVFIVVFALLSERIVRRSHERKRILIRLTECAMAGALVGAVNVIACMSVAARYLEDYLREMSGISTPYLGISGPDSPFGRLFVDYQLPDIIFTFFLYFAFVFITLAWIDQEKRSAGGRERAGSDGLEFSDPAPAAQQARLP